LSYSGWPTSDGIAVTKDATAAALKMQVGVFQRERRGKAKEGLGTSPVRLGRVAGKARTDGLGAC